MEVSHGHLAGYPIDPLGVGKIHQKILLANMMSSPRHEGEGLGEGPESGSSSGSGMRFMEKDSPGVVSPSRKLNS